MNMKNLVVSLAFAGVVVSPVSFAVSSALESAKFKASEQPATFVSNMISKEFSASKLAGKSPDGVLSINNMITIAQAHQVVAGRSSGRVISVMLDTEYGAPKYEFILLEGANVKSILIHGESGAVIDEHVFDQNIYQAPASLSSVLANVESQLEVSAVAAELEADQTSGAYRVLATKDDTMVEVLASSDTGAVLAAYIYEDDMEDGYDDGMDDEVESSQRSSDGEGEDDGEDGELEFISLTTAIAAAEQAAPGTVVAIGLDDEMDDEMDDEYDDEGDDYEGDGEDDENDGEGDGEDDDDGENDDGQGDDEGEDDDWEGEDDDWEGEDDDWEGEDDDWDGEDDDWDGEDDDWDDEGDEEGEDDEWDDEEDDRANLAKGNAFFIGGELPIDLPKDSEDNDDGEDNGEDDSQGDDEAGEDDDEGDGEDDGQDDDSSEMANPTYIVELQEGMFIHRVSVDAVTGEVVNVERDDYQALEQAITAATTWANMDTVLANVSAAQAGNVDSIDLMLMDSALVYEVFISATDGDYLAIVDAATANVLSVSLDDGEDDYEGDDGEDDGEGEDTAED